MYFDGNYEKRVKVVIREVEGGKKHFWSIMPFWKKSGDRIKLYSGDLGIG